MGKGEFWHPMKSKSLKFFKFELDFHDYVPKLYTSENFHFNPFSGGFSPAQIGEILRFYDFFLQLLGYTVFYSRDSPRSNPWMDFHGLWLTRRVFAKERSSWGLRQYRNLFGGNIPKTPPKWAWIGSFKPNGPDIKITISCKIQTRSTCNLE